MNAGELMEILKAVPPNAEVAVYFVESDPAPDDSEPFTIERIASAEYAGRIVRLWVNV